MGKVTCTRCGRKVDEFSTFFAESGQVCEQCNSAGELQDAQEFRDGANQESMSMNGNLSSSSSSTEVDEDGNVHTSTTTLSVNAGFLGMIIKLIMSFFKK